MAPLPAPIRAGLGLLATALDTVQELVEHAPEIPMEAVGNSMQLSMRLQQQYVALMTRGDEFIASLRGAPDEPPAWATFDDLAPTTTNGSDSADDLADDKIAGDLADGGLASHDADRAIFDDDVLDVPAAELQDEPRQAGQGDPLLDAVTSALEATAAAGSAPVKAPAKKVAGRKIAAKKAPAEKKVAEKVAGEKVAGEKVAGEKVAAQKVASKKVAAQKLAGKKVAAKKGPADADPPVAAAGELPSIRKVSPRRAPAKASAKKAAVKQTATKEAGARALSADSFTAPPRLDADLDNGDASARPLSAFDLADNPAADTPADHANVNASAPVELTAPASTADAPMPAGGSAPGLTPGF